VVWNNGPSAVLSMQADVLAALWQQQWP